MNKKTYAFNDTDTLTDEEIDEILKDIDSVCGSNEWEKNKNG